MRMVFGLVLLLGLGLAGFAVYMAQGYISAQRDAELARERAARRTQANRADDGSRVRQQASRSATATS